MQDIVLNLDPSTWNVLKFIILTIITTPLLEFLFQRFINTKAAYDVVRGKQVQFAESNFGLLSLHSVYWGPRRNSIYLLLVASLVFAAELVFEFSFSTQALDIVERRDVWLPLSHAEHYAPNGTLRGDEQFEPFHFPLSATETCIEGESEMRRRGRLNQTDGQYISGFEYHMEDTYVIRRPYLALDNSTVLCSISKTIGSVRFFVPHVYLVNSSSGAEGVLALVNTSNSENVRHSLTSDTFEYFGSLTGAQVTASDHSVCTRVRMSAKQIFLCAMYVMDAFILAHTSQIWSEKVPSNTLLSVIMNATGKPVQGMKSRKRKLRYLTSVIGNELVNTILGERPSHKLISKNNMEMLAMLVLIVANEEGVGGSQHKIGKRSFVVGQQQTATMKKLAFVPIAIVVFFIAFLLVAEVTFSKLIVSSSKNSGRNGGDSILCDLRVSTSIQWLRERICDDLLHDGVFKNITTSDLSIKTVSGEFQMLPKVQCSS